MWCHHLVLCAHNVGIITSDYWGLIMVGVRSLTLGQMMICDHPPTRNGNLSPNWGGGGGMQGAGGVGGFISSGPPGAT